MCAARRTGMSAIVPASREHKAQKGDEDEPREGRPGQDALLKEN